MRLGIGSYTYVWCVGVPGYGLPERPLTVWDLLDRANDLGVSVVQIADNLPLNCLSDIERNRFARQANESGISIEIGIAGIDRDGLLQGLKLAEEFQSPILRVLIDTHSSQPTVDEVVTSLIESVPDFARSNVVLAIENHDRFDSITLREIMKRVSSPFVGICFDTANSIGCLESADRVLDALEPYIVNVHVKDYCLFRPAHLKGFVVEGRPAGQGELDLPKLISRFKQISYDGNLIVELWPPPQSTLAETIALETVWAEESVRYLRQFVNE